jgi:hypothetical protein
MWGIVDQAGSEKGLSFTEMNSYMPMFDVDHCCCLYTRCAQGIYFVNTANQEKDKATPKPQQRKKFQQPW